MSAYPDGTRDEMTESIDVIADALAAPGGLEGHGVVVTTDDDGVFVENGERSIYFAADQARWLFTTAGPSVLYALRDFTPLEDVTGPGGGPEPATAKASEPDDGQMSLEGGS